MAMLSSFNNTLITGGNFNAAHGDIHNSYFISDGQKGMDLLANSIAPGAFHNSSERYDPPKCHPSTRVAVLQHIMTWVNDLQKLCFFMWLYGPAGAGKSAIAQSIAELCYKANILAASFFFSRTAVGRNNESRLIPTLVYQLCVSMPVIRRYVEETIEQDPFVLSRSLEAQISGLVVDPLRRALLDEKAAKSLHSGPKLIIIDGLDECGTGKVQRYVLTVLATAIRKIPLPISFLVASRPEQIIRDTFHAEPLSSMARRLALDDSYRPDDDIKRFFQSKFDEIKQNHPLRCLLPSGWPSDSELIRLVQKSSGQFIYASTVIKYLDSPYQRPTDALDIIFGLSNPGFDTPFTELDALYLHIFSTVKHIKKALELISFLLLSQTDMLLTPKLLESLFFLRRGDVHIILSDLHSIMHVSAPTIHGHQDAIRIFHASLGDFLLDKSRSDKFHIDLGNAHANLTQCFLKHFSKRDLSTSKEDSSLAEAFIKHCPLSSPTLELLGDLHEFDFHRFLTTFHSLEIVMSNLFYIFDWIKQHFHQNPSWENLYSHLLHSFDGYLRSQLVHLMSFSNLVPLILAAVMLPNFLQHSPSILDLLSLNNDPLSAFSRACRSVIWPFGWHDADPYMANYHILLSEFLGDPMRSKEFFADGDKFATLAKIFSKYLFGPSIISKEQLRQREPQTFFYAFSDLPYCLPKASPSKDLAVFLQTHAIPSNFPNDLPHECNPEATIIAINAYIMRCNVTSFQGR